MQRNVVSRAHTAVWSDDFLSCHECEAACPTAKGPPCTSTFIRHLAAEQPYYGSRTCRAESWKADMSGGAGSR